MVSSSSKLKKITRLNGKFDDGKAPTWLEVDGKLYRKKFGTAFNNYEEMAKHSKTNPESIVIETKAYAVYEPATEAASRQLSEIKSQVQDKSLPKSDRAKAARMLADAKSHLYILK